MDTQKLDIRRAEPEDYRALQQIHSQPRVVWGTLQVPFPSADAWKRRLSERAESRYWLVACIDGKVVGVAGLEQHTRSPRRRHAAELGMAVHDRWQGRGIGGALLGALLDVADHWFDVTRVELTVYVDNAPAIELYERAGFEVEGTLRGYAYRGGAYVDAYAMARVR